MLGVSIKETTNHPLILRVMPFGFALEKFDAALAQCKRDLHALFSEDEVLRGREEICDDLGPPKGLVGVSDSRAHGSACLFASNLRR